MDMPPFVKNEFQSCLSFLPEYRLHKSFSYLVGKPTEKKKREALNYNGLWTNINFLLQSRK